MSTLGPRRTREQQPSTDFRVVFLAPPALADIPEGEVRRCQREMGRAMAGKSGESSGGGQQRRRR